MINVTPTSRNVTRKIQAIYQNLAQNWLCNIGASQINGNVSDTKEIALINKTCHNLNIKI